MTILFFEHISAFFVMAFLFVLNAIIISIKNLIQKKHGADIEDSRSKGKKFLAMYLNSIVIYILSGVVVLVLLLIYRALEGAGIQNNMLSGMLESRLEATYLLMFIMPVIWILLSLIKFPFFKFSMYRQVESSMGKKRNKSK